MTVPTAAYNQQPHYPGNDEARRVIAAISQSFEAKVVGQSNLRESLLIGLLSGGHILLESVPGLAKTTAARVLAESIDGQFHRIQCTPDLLPSDIIGTQIYNAAKSRFDTYLGPVHSNIVLLDEINRSSAKTQSAMLEAMQERATTIAGETVAIEEPFLVIATQNPVDQEGTYPLSEAQTDRFMLKETLHYPTPREEVLVMEKIDAGVYEHPSQPVISREDVIQLQRIVAGAHLDPALTAYAADLVSVTRTLADYPQTAPMARYVQYGASPRATIAFCKAARAYAVLQGRDYVHPGDIAAVAHRVLRHRLILGFEAAGAGLTSENVIDAVLQAIRVPT
ncbi:MAG: MoxR family ATPase [Actinomycetia bacterium]|nr:MoxR family ATPase [Actinomycetes bacterium]